MPMQITTQAQAQVQVKHALSLDLKVIRALLAEVSFDCLLSVRNQLILSGDVVLEDDLGLEADQVLEDEFESEIDLGDEDEPAEADETDASFIADNAVSWTHNAVYSLIVEEEANGNYRVDAPPCGWEGLKGCKPKGQQCIAAVSARQLFYARLAAWLEAKYQLLLKAGPFSGSKIKKAQNELLTEKLDGHPLIKGIETLSGKAATENLSRYLKHIDLSWPQGAFPLRELFTN